MPVEPFDDVYSVGFSAHHKTVNRFLGIIVKLSWCTMNVTKVASNETKGYNTIKKGKLNGKNL